MITVLTRDVAVKYVESVGMEIGSWNDIRGEKGSIDSFQAPTSASDLAIFSQYLAAWLPFGASWKLIQIDNSTAFSRHESITFGSVLLKSKDLPNFNQFRAILFDFEKDVDNSKSTELIISHAIFMLLLFKAHAQLICSDASSRRILSLQDGFAYLMRPGVPDIGNSGSDSKIDFSIYPEWIREIDSNDE